MSLTPEIKVIEKSSPDFPNSVADMLGTKAPDRLHCLGNLELLTKPGVGFCGSRKSTDKGLETAADCASQAAENDVTVVSGNAAGVDLTAHREALRSGGSTILVLPEGINNFRVRRELRDHWDWNRVLVLSQFHPDAVWRSYQAMSRNQTIIALSGAMIVIEAGEKGGTLAAGKQTLKANRPLFVAKYANERPESVGNLVLLSLGGIPLKRLKSTDRANMAKVWESFSAAHQFVQRPRLI